jgi:hypothetical protein
LEWNDFGITVGVLFWISSTWERWGYRMMCRVTSPWYKWGFHFFNKNFRNFRAKNRAQNNNFYYLVRRRNMNRFYDFLRD